MYNIIQLDAMNEEQLRELAKSMGIKKVDSVERQQLVYQVLDHQAELEAANTPEPVKRRRERIRQPAAKANGNEVTKDDAVATKKQSKKDQNTQLDAKLAEASSIQQPAVPDNQPQPEPEAPAMPKRKRGRPSAAEKAAREAALKAQQETQVAPQQDNEAAAEVEPVAVTEQPQRRRGRKPKQAAAVAEPVLPFEETVQEMTDEAKPEDAATQSEVQDSPVDENGIQASQEQPAAQSGTNETREREGVSLNSFFNTGSSFTFKPRTQQEREEAMRRAEEERKRAAEEAAAAPIVIQQEQKAQNEAAATAADCRGESISGSALQF